MEMKREGRRPSQKICQRRLKTTKKKPTSQKYEQREKLSTTFTCEALGALHQLPTHSATVHSFVIIVQRGSPACEQAIQEIVISNKHKRSRKEAFWIFKKKRLFLFSARIFKFLFRFFRSLQRMEFLEFHHENVSKSERKEGEEMSPEIIVGSRIRFVCVGRSKCLQGIGMEFIRLFFFLIEMKSSDKVGAVDGWSEKDNRSSVRCAIFVGTIDHLEN